MHVESVLCQSEVRATFKEVHVDSMPAPAAIALSCGKVGWPVRWPRSGLVAVLDASGAPRELPHRFGSTIARILVSRKPQSLHRRLVLDNREPAWTASREFIACGTQDTINESSRTWTNLQPHSRGLVQEEFHSPCGALSRMPYEASFSSRCYLALCNAGAHGR